MAEKLPVRDFEHQTFSAILGGQRYSMTLRWNPACSVWTVRVAQNGTNLVGFVPLVQGQINITALPCLPASFGGLYLEVVDSTVAGSEALISGAQCLWFFHSAEVFLMFGTVNP